MFFIHNNSIEVEKHVKEVLWHYIVIILVCFIAAKMLSYTLWSQQLGLLHTILEAVCIFIAVATFLVIWHNYDYVSKKNQIMGIGFLVVALFDILHVYYYPSLNHYPKGYYDLSTWYWILGRSAEAIVLFIGMKAMFGVRGKKAIGLLLALTPTSVIVFLTFEFKRFLPNLLIEGQGVTNFRIILEYVIISMFLFTMYSLKDRFKDSKDVIAKYILMSILLTISTGLCFTLSKNINSFTTAYGHILKVICYYYLFRGIFISSITAPYKTLEASKKNTEDMFNALSIAVMTYDKNSKLLFTNSKAKDILGSELEEMVGLSVYDMAKHFCLYNTFEKYINQKEVYDVSKKEILVVRNKDQVVSKLIFSIQKLNDGGFIFMFDEAKKEQELQNLQLQTRTILDSINNTVLMVDKGNKIIMCNKALQEMVSMEEQEILGMDYNQFNQLIQFKSNEVLNTMPEEPACDKAFEATFETLQGEKKEMVYYAARIFNVDGEDIGYIGVGTDVTELKQEQEKLKQQEKLALLGQMGASIVHETKNLLATIKGCCQLILLKEKDDNIRKYAQKIDTVTNDVNTVICDFLSLARPRSPEFKEVSLNRLIKNMTFMIESAALIKGIGVFIVPSPIEKTVLVDESQIRQVVLNLSKNAIDAMVECEDPRLMIGTEISEDEEEMYIIISDTGKGMSDREKEKVGTPFFTTKESGTGLGLSVCYQIIKEHSGRIDIQSELGEGTWIVITLPCTTAHFKGEQHSLQDYAS